MGLPCIGANSLLDTHTVTSSIAAATGFPLSNLYDDKLFENFKNSSAGTTLDIVTDAGSGNTASVNYLAIMSHDLAQPAGAGAAVTWTFAHSADNVSYTTIATATAEAGIIFRKFSTLYTNRYFRLRLTRGASFVASIGEIQWGTAVEFPYSLDWKGFDPTQSTLEGKLNRSQTGNMLGAILINEERFNKVKFDLLPYSFTHGTTLGTFGHFWTNHGKLLKPVVFAWNPGDPGSFEKDAYFCIFRPTDDLGRPLATVVDSGFRDLEFTLEGQAE